MRVASITMVGQFPDGIDIHARNLHWALTNRDHSYIITTSKIIEEQKLVSSKFTTYIPFHVNNTEGFINFWVELPKIIRDNKIKPEWFLFMESDIWFFARLMVQENPKIIRSYLPRGGYRNILLKDKVFHSRVWEGSQLIHGDIVRNAIDFGINFSFVKETFLDRNREKYEEKFGGPIKLSMYNTPDTMDEFGFYCALEEGTKIENIVKALHMRGPESVHRICPDMYRGATQDRLQEVQKKFPYMDILLVVAVYYIVGLWTEINHLDWVKSKGESKREINRLLVTGREWMKPEEYVRLQVLKSLMQLKK